MTDVRATAPAAILLEIDGLAVGYDGMLLTLPAGSKAIETSTVK